ncbi:unnamed protein product [marine sediment metagenome]|uniref:NIF system FeS cluster assembly NifU N-terminal domain-containing protein n=1 Tax=marine sediment metagenome TaxID=412755 RepID=X1BGW7_9ZZZZ
MDKEDHTEFEKAGAHVDKCPSVVSNAAKWAAEILINDDDILNKHRRNK